MERRDFDHRSGPDDFASGVRFSFFQTIAGPDDEPYPDSEIDTARGCIYYAQQIKYAQYTRGHVGQDDLDASFTAMAYKTHLFVLQGAFVPEETILLAVQFGGGWYVIAGIPGSTSNNLLRFLSMAGAMSAGDETGTATLDDPEEDEEAEITIDNAFSQPIPAEAKALGLRIAANTYVIVQSQFYPNTVVTDVTCNAGALLETTGTIYLQT